MHYDQMKAKWVFSTCVPWDEKLLGLPPLYFTKELKWEELCVFIPNFRQNLCLYFSVCLSLCSHKVLIWTNIIAYFLTLCRRTPFWASRPRGGAFLDKDVRHTLLKGTVVGDVLKCLYIRNWVQLQCWVS